MGNRYAAKGTMCRRIDQTSRRSLRTRKRRLGKAEAALDRRRSSDRLLPPRFAVSGDKAEARGSHGAGLARHGVGQALALERGRQVHFAAGKEAGKKLHDHLHSVAQTGRLRLMEWGSSFVDDDIGLREGKLNRKSEALDMKSDTECDKFGHSAQDFRLFTMRWLSVRAAMRLAHMRHATATWLGKII